jgi:acyl carrier protein
VLRLDRVGIRDNFFEIGGHSLLATRVVSRIRDAFGIDIPLHWIFQTPTIEEIASRVSGLTPDKDEDAPIACVDRSAPLPLSFAQQRLWFLDPSSGSWIAMRRCERLL